MCGTENKFIQNAATLRLSEKLQEIGNLYPIKVHTLSNSIMVKPVDIKTHEGKLLTED